MSFAKSKLFLILLIIGFIVLAYLCYDLAVFYWQNIDMTNARKFVTRWEEYTLFAVVNLLLYAGIHLRYKD